MLDFQVQGVGRACRSTDVYVKWWSLPAIGPLLQEPGLRSPAMLEPTALSHLLIWVTKEVHGKLPYIELDL